MPSPKTPVALDTDQLFAKSALVNIAEQLRSRTMAKEVAQALPNRLSRPLTLR
jgi:hypothetical protein